MCRLCYWHMTRDDRFTWIRQYFNCCAADSQTDEEGASKQTNQNPSEAIVSAYDCHRIFGKFLLIVRDLEANWIHQCGISSHFRYCVRAIDITYLASSFEKTDNPRLFQVAGLFSFLQVQLCRWDLNGQLQQSQSVLSIYLRPCINQSTAPLEESRGLQSAFWMPNLLKGECKIQCRNIEFWD